MNFKVVEDSASIRAELEIRIHCLSDIGIDMILAGETRMMGLRHAASICWHELTLRKANILAVVLNGEGGLWYGVCAYADQRG
jgi:hypothetical protein